MTKKEHAKIVKLLAEVEGTKAKMAKLRDTLREQISDLEGVLDSISEGIECFSDGRRSFDDGLDYFSQYI